MRQISKIRRFRLVAALFAGMLILLGAGDDSTRIERLGHQMMCVCGACNQYLLECNHVGCAYSERMRSELTSAVDSGKSDSGVLQFFIEKYGATVLAAPTKTGFDRVAWVIPYLALVLGIGVIVLAMRSLKIRLAVAPGSAISTLSSGDLDRFRDQARKETEL
jgi:cytochrome c-type biogenesis protein CcmH